MATVLNKIIDLARFVNLKIDLMLAGAQKTDTLFIAAFIGVAVLMSLVLKRRKIILLSVAVYVVTALYQAVPLEWALNFGNNVWIFLGATATVFWLLRSTIASGIYGGAGGDYAGRIKLVLLSFITLGFMVSSALNFVTDVDILSRIDLVNRLFSGGLSRTVWAILPLAGFLFLRK
ncbi:MAG: hypothetical protein HYT38_00780 [Candidatus Sungbacteria bacterium]|uniref:Uncharacterized protein n=1 Tax=Candidatus Sungiibacteriota bacterium TaxID=2750080 RepID=A0A932DSD2_9BACT|nr:hypothetical protein [Candidatus Sungbacteria bacterium]MBI2465749.1 hypothetical protein [Candidatus Sungbacteria bacterium]